MYKVLNPNNNPTYYELALPSNVQQKEKSDYNFQKYVGWKYSALAQNGYDKYFSESNIQAIQKTIHSILKEQGYNIIPSIQVVQDVMSTVLNYNTPTVGDMYTIYTIPSNNPRNDLENMNQRVINIISSNIINEYDTIRNNQELSAWVNVKGDSNPWGLRSHSKIRKRENDIVKGFFMTNY